MHPRDFPLLFQMIEGDPAARRDRVLNAVVDYRFLAPHKLAADELRQREMARAAIAAAASEAVTLHRGLRFGSLRHRLGAVLIAAGTRLQRGAVLGLDPSPGT